MKINNSPLVSVVVPVFNAAKYLSKCLDSVINQSMRAIEIICVNDGSEDESLKIIKEYIKKDSRIRLIDQENSGVSSARNSGIKEASGECIVFVDADDYIDLRMLEILWENYKKNNADIIVFGGLSFPSVDWVNKKLSTRDVIYNFDSINALFYEPGSIPFVWNKMFRLDLIRKRSILFDLNLPLGEDQVFQFLIFPTARKIQYISEKLYHYRVEIQDSAMAKFGKNFKLKNNQHLKLVQTIVDEWRHQGYLSSNERHLLRWMVKFFKNCTVDTQTHAAYFSREVMSLFNQVHYIPGPNDDFYETHQKIIKTAETKYSPKISVIVPVFNVEDVLPQCIDSLLAQTFKDFEIIFIDDGSLDNSLAILRKYEDLDSRVTVLQQNNKFAGVARNYGMEKAGGEYLIFLDSDDLFEPNLLSELYASVTEHDCDVCVCAAKSYNHVTGEYKEMPWVCKTRFIPNGTIFSKNNIDLNKYLYCFTTPVPWNKIFKKSFVRENNLYFQNTRSANDMFFSFMCLSLAKKIVVNSKELLSYRVNNSNSLQSTQDRDFYAFYDALCKLKNGLLERNIYEEVKTQFVNFSLDCCLYNLGTMKKKENFLEMYFFIKSVIFQELGIEEKNASFFYGYTPNNGERKEMLSTLSAEDYIKKFNIKFSD